MFGKPRFHLEIIHTQTDRDVLVVEQHLLKHRGVAIAGQGLELVVKILVVSVGPHWQPGQHGGVQVCRPLVPLLLGVGLEDLLVEVPAHPGDGHLLAILRSLARRRPSLVQPGLHVGLVLQLLPEQSVDGVNVGRDGNDPLRVIYILKLSVITAGLEQVSAHLDSADNSVVVGRPLAELLDVVLHPGVLGVEDVDTVERDPDAVLVNVVVAVSPDVIPLVYDEGGETQLTAGPLRYDGSGEAGTHHYQVVLLLQTVDTAVQ